MRHNNNSDRGLLSTLRRWWNFIINWWRSFDPNAMKSHDSLLKNYMKPVGLTTWKQLRDHVKISRSTLHYLRTGQADHLPIHTLKAIAQHLNTDWTKLLQDFSNITFPNLGEQYYQECQRLQEQLDNQTIQLTRQIQEQTFQKITPLLVQYPTLQQVVQQKRPDLPATTVLNLLKSLENLLQDWGIEPIGTPWQQVTFDPELHQPDTEDIYPGEAVYIRFIGYRTPTRILVRAKVSRTLPEV
jgi:molecular chaperone GrpE (heat shock protein)